jgi:hypothetical protein
VLICDGCRESIDGSCGYAFTDVRSAWRRAEEYERWTRRRLRYGVVNTRPPRRVGWHLVHRGCHVTPDYRRLYLVPADRLRSDRGLLELVLELSTQKWAEHTAWRVLVKRIITPNPRPR